MTEESNSKGQERQLDLARLMGLDAESERNCDQTGEELQEDVILAGGSYPKFSPALGSGPGKRMDAGPRPPSIRPVAKAQKQGAPVQDSRPARGPQNGTWKSLWMSNPKRYGFVMEGLRIIKNKLTALKEKEGQSVFLITGADFRAGASTIAINLSMLMAQDLLDQRILLIDANPTKPGLHKVFDLPVEEGLMDYLLDDCPLDSIVKSSSLSNLDLITLGTVDQNVTSPFDLMRFQQLMEEARELYEFVLFDSAPVLRSSHSRILSPKVDGVIIIVEANASRWEVLIEIKNQLEMDGARLLGGVLNKRRFVIPKWVYRFI